MPGLRVAVNSGSWSNPAIWNNGFLPGAGDIVCANGFTVTIDQDINVGRLTTAASSIVSAIPTMTGYTTPSGTVIRSSDAGGDLAWRAFDGSTSLTPAWYAAGGAPQWLGYIFPSSIAINKYALALRGAGDPYTPRNWTFEGSNDGVTWTVLHTVTAYSGANPYTSPDIGNTTLYTQYRINVSQVQTPPNVPIILEFYMYELNYTTSGVAGGGFTITGSRNITCTNSTSILAGTTNALTVSSSAPVTVNAVTITTNGNSYGINQNGTGTLNIVGNIVGAAGANAGGGMVVNSTGTVNIIGSISITSYAFGLLINGASTVNITGDVITNSLAGGGLNIVVNNSAAIVNITGNIYGQSNAGNSNSSVRINTNSSVVNITGTIFPVTGVIASNVNTISTAANCFLRIIGPIIGCASNLISTTVSSTGTGAINLFSGPFICGNYGAFPYSVTRMHLIPTLNNYIEFRDNSTNGALSPGPIASASRMVSADTIIDTPLASNVRFGVSYGNGAFTGTCKIPSPSNVSLNVPFDTGSVGTAFLSATDIAQMATNIWNIPTANLTGSNTIGARMASSSTVDTMGNQLVSLL